MISSSLPLRRGWIAARAAWSAPRVIETGLASLLCDPPHAAHPRDPEPGRTLLATQRALDLLSRLPGAHWRRTCLYRSVAGCLALRAGGHDARVVIGVRTGATGAHPHVCDVVAHAWIECASAAPRVEQRASRALVPLRPPGAELAAAVSVSEPG